MGGRTRGGATVVGRQLAKRAQHARGGPRPLGPGTLHSWRLLHPGGGLITSQPAGGAGGRQPLARTEASFVWQHLRRVAGGRLRRPLRASAAPLPRHSIACPSDHLLEALSGKMATSLRCLIVFLLASLIFAAPHDGHDHGHDHDHEGHGHDDDMKAEACVVSAAGAKLGAARKGAGGAARASSARGLPARRCPGRPRAAKGGVGFFSLSCTPGAPSQHWHDLSKPMGRAAGCAAGRARRVPPASLSAPPTPPPCRLAAAPPGQPCSSELHKLQPHRRRCEGGPPGTLQGT